MKYDADRRVLMVGPHELPAKFFIHEHYDYPEDHALTWHDGHKLSQETRVFRCQFENRWSLSIIWGSMTYSDNHHHPWGTNWCSDGHERIYPEFNEEPLMVEVAIVTPEPRIVPEQSFTLPAIAELPERTHTVPEYEMEIWGDVIGYVDAESLWNIVNTVKTFDSNGMPPPEDGPYLESLEPDGPRFLVWTHNEVASEH